jgi:hypothetical protein
MEFMDKARIVHEASQDGRLPELDLLGDPKFEDIVKHATGDLTARELEVLEIYWERHKANKHKMDPIPVYKLGEDIRRYRGVK